MTAPTFFQQQNLDASLREIFRRTLQRLTGAVPTDEQLAHLVRAELSDLFRDLGEEHCRRLAEQTAISVGEPAGETDARSTAALLTGAQVVEAASNLHFAQSNGIPSILEALQWYARHREGALRAPPLRQCIREFLISKRCEGLRELTLKTYRINLAKFAAQFGDSQPVSVTPKQISDYLMGWKTDSVRHAQWLALSIFYSWASKLRYALENPVPRDMKQPKSEAPSRFIFTPAEARRFLKRIKHTSDIGFWALAMFSGLRAGEIRRIALHPSPWSLIRLDTGVIEVTSQLAKTRGRLVPIQPVLRQWVKWIKFRKAPLYPPNHRDRCRWVRAILADRLGEPLEGELGSPGQKDQRFFNIARRSYLSYRLALPGSSLTKVSEEAGNSEVILRRFYDRRATAAEARQYFALTPYRV